MLLGTYFRPDSLLYLEVRHPYVTPRELRGGTGFQIPPQVSLLARPESTWDPLMQ